MVHQPQLARLYLIIELNRIQISEFQNSKYYMWVLLKINQDGMVLR